nr:uncharacterized protein LOC129382571 [Dermacentor andersoni]
MEEDSLTSSSLSSRRCLGYESEEQAPRGSQHRVQATVQQPDQALREQSSARNTYGMGAAKSSGSLRLHKYDETFEEPREGLPLSHPIYPAGMESRPQIFQHSLQGTSHDHGRSLHDVHGTVHPFLRSDSAIHISKLSSETQCSYAQGIHGDTEQLSLQPHPDNTHDTRVGLRARWR